MEKTGDNCGDYKPKPPNDVHVTFDSAAMSDRTLFCDEDGHAFWLVNLARTQDHHNQCQDFGANCPPAPPAVNALPGTDDLDGTQFGGITLAMMAASAVRSWKGNGMKNGWGELDPEAKDGVADIIDNGINAKGIVNIPVCSFAEASANGWPGVDGDFWPCGTVQDALNGVESELTGPAGAALGGLIG
jgi:hypothetical protein